MKALILAILVTILAFPVMANVDSQRCQMIGEELFCGGQICPRIDDKFFC